MANEVAKPCSVRFWTFAIPVLAGNMAAYGAGYLAQKLYKNDHATTQESALLAAKFGAFWLVAGFAWIAMCKREGAAK